MTIPAIAPPEIPEDALLLLLAVSEADVPEVWLGAVFPEPPTATSVASNLLVTCATTVRLTVAVVIVVMIPSARVLVLVTKPVVVVVLRIER